MKWPFLDGVNQPNEPIVVVVIGVVDTSTSQNSAFRRTGTVGVATLCARVSVAHVTG